MKPVCLLLVPAFILSLATTDAGAQSWPTKPLRAVVPVAAGSSTDIIPRIVFEQLSQQFGQTIVVENRAGAGGTIGAAFVAKSEPDGYTILVSGAIHTIAPALYPKLTYHPARDFAAVVPLGISPNVRSSFRRRKASRPWAISLPPRKAGPARSTSLQLVLGARRI
jgi:tripartite-type tricarboxylate transporter receptor subunit TctC